MFREISEEVRVNLKDRLREARQSIRSHRHDAPPAKAHMRQPFPLNELEGLLGHAASAFDDVMTVAETLAPRRLGGATVAAAKPFGVYFPSDNLLEGERAFRRDVYALGKAVLAARRMEDMRVSEAGLVAVHAAFARQQSEPLADLARATAWTDRIALVAALTASLLVEMARRQTLRRNDMAGGGAPEPALSTDIACLAPVALVCGLATMEAGNRAEPDLLEIAMLAIDARFDRILAAFAGGDTQGDLTALFATLLAHLP